ncbi:molybdopterin-binding protein [Pedobacter ginsengisoli]|uniref:Molybdopterin-binding protein n=1 Tax=Pedobacter ginsengisoli TaxID=363852 RepID=A0A2D1U2F9_9SPHI|nr:molybdopterin-binding protein [Pedobacter ginsengisoli]ATP55798.1 molybdopterin-binding protein [Pedobacter ginsengisoli]
MKCFKPTLPLSLLIVLIAFTRLSAQDLTKQAAAAIKGEVKTELILTVTDVDKLPKTTIIQKDRADKEYTYSGVELGIVLKNAGVTMAEELKGKNLSKYLLVEASDGYQVVFSLAEVDPSFTSRKIILANRKDGYLLSPEEGPFHIIIEGEKRKPRNARQVISLTIKFTD